MIGTHTFIPDGSVLEVVAVAVLHDVVPLDGHLRRVERVIIFRIQIVDVILGINGLYVLAERLERFHLSLHVSERKPDLRE